MTIWYFPLEPIKGRYTEQLCNEWMPDTFKLAGIYDDVKTIKGDPPPPHEIVHGCVLDAFQRSSYSLSQCRDFLAEAQAGKVKNTDVIFLQDFFTPGFESVLYTLSVLGLTGVKVCAMVHAQSVDQFDFTHGYAYWMRGSEFALANWIHKTGGCLFMASTCHVHHWRNANLPGDIHVVGLPIHQEMVKEYAVKFPDHPTDGELFQHGTFNVVYSSRVSPEKNPDRLIQIAKKIETRACREINLIICSGGTLPESFKKKLNDCLGSGADQVYTRENLTKEEYYWYLQKADAQLNTASQDYVSWTLLEAIIFGCQPIYPNFRSFPEIIPEDYLYDDSGSDAAEAAFKKILDVSDLRKDSRHGNERTAHLENIVHLCEYGRIQESFILRAMSQGHKLPLVNVWGNLTPEQESNPGDLVSDLFSAMSKITGAVPAVKGGVHL